MGEPLGGDRHCAFLAHGATDAQLGSAMSTLRLSSIGAFREVLWCLKIIHVFVYIDGLRATSC